MEACVSLFAVTLLDLVLPVQGRRVLLASRRELQRRRREQRLVGQRGAWRALWRVRLLAMLPLLRRPLSALLLLLLRIGPPASSSSSSSFCC